MAIICPPELPRRENGIVRYLAPNRSSRLVPCHRAHENLFSIRADGQIHSGMTDDHFKYSRNGSYSSIYFLFLSSHSIPTLLHVSAFPQTLLSEDTNSRRSRGTCQGQGASPGKSQRHTGSDGSGACGLRPGDVPTRRPFLRYLRFYEKLKDVAVPGAWPTLAGRRRGGLCQAGRESVGLLQSHGKGDPPHGADRKPKSLRESRGNLREIRPLQERSWTPCPVTPWAGPSA